jgi:hypothetical protein
MAMTLLAMAQAVSDEISFARPASLFSNPDTTARQMLALANREGMEQSSAFAWPQLRRLEQFDTVSGTQAYDMPADFSRMIAATIWSEGLRWPLLGPLTPQEWATQIYGWQNFGPRARFRLMQNQMWLWPIPDSVDTIVYEYEGTGWALNADGVTYQSAWLNDTDTFALDEQAFMLGLKWRLLRAKGQDYQQEQKTYVDALDRAMGRSAGNRTLSLGGQNMGVRLLDWNNIPSTGFGE